MINYGIKKDYVSRLHNLYFDDTLNKDEWQSEVYNYAKTKFDANHFNTVLDIGCGSAYKLIKHFDNNDTLGIDLPQTVAWLKARYPNKKWTDKFEPIQNYDMIIASDVIEHLIDPDTLLDFIVGCNSKLIIFSTPNRELLNNPNGPPNNPTHVREWTMTEFRNYITSRFNILEHFMSNISQATQVILATVK